MQKLKPALRSLRDMGREITDGREERKKKYGKRDNRCARGTRTRNMGSEIRDARAPEEDRRELGAQHNKKHLRVGKQF